MEWQPGTSIAAPVYLDANVLVGAVVRGHRLYAKTAQLIGELLASQARILVSLLTVQESLWALARIFYYELANQPPDAHFSQSIYKRWRDRIFQAHGPQMEAPPSMLQDWTYAGVMVEVVPRTDSDFLEVTSRIPKYMRQYELTPADAAHLALAEVYASTFATADSGFQRVVQQAPPHPLNILHLVP